MYTCMIAVHVPCAHTSEHRKTHVRSDAEVETVDGHDAAADCAICSAAESTWTGREKVSIQLPTAPWSFIYSVPSAVREGYRTLEKPDVFLDSHPCPVHHVPCTPHASPARLTIYVCTWKCVYIQELLYLSTLCRPPLLCSLLRTALVLRWCCAGAES